MLTKTLLTLAGLLFLGTAIAGAAPDSTQTRKAKEYPWKLDIVTTFFWIGHDPTTYNSSTNFKSAWDSLWTENYGGTDDPNNRCGYLPKGVAVTLNPFYCALPFNDVAYPDMARRMPWYKTPKEGERYVSQCKGRWLQIRNRATGKMAYAQWEDVGPFRTDHVDYVFGNDRPTSVHSGAGLDVSPAVRDFLELKGLDRCDWRFVEDVSVPDGPWLKCGEQALIMRTLKEQAKNNKSTLKLLTPGGSNRNNASTGVGTNKRVGNDKM